MSVLYFSLLVTDFYRLVHKAGFARIFYLFCPRLLITNVSLLFKIIHYPHPKSNFLERDKTIMVSKPSKLFCLPLGLCFGRAVGLEKVLRDSIMIPFNLIPEVQTNLDLISGENDENLNEREREMNHQLLKMWHSINQ